jgi:hypothetical protein
LLLLVGVRDSKIQAVAIDERSNDAAIEVLLGPATMVRLSKPACYRFIAIPVAFDP